MPEPSPGPEPAPIKPSEVSELARIARDHGLSEIIIRHGDTRVELRLALGETNNAAIPAAAAAPAPAAPERPANLIELVSPMTGVFFTAPSPDEPPYIHPGDIVREGEPIGLIEAMKVFSEVLADHSGRVRHIRVSNGQLVRQGETLVELMPLEPHETGGGHSR